MKKHVIFLCILLIILLILPLCSVSLFNQPAETTVPILMFHDIKTSEGGVWSISAENFRNTLVFLLDNGYTPIFFNELVNYVENGTDLPSKPVVITLDDGYFSNYRLVLPIITELGVPVTIFMTCGTVRANDEIPSTDENVLCKMSWEELRTMEASPFVKIQSHSYALHSINTSYSDIQRDNSLPLETEDKDKYKENFLTDCIRAEEVLLNVGVDRFVAFSYPSGKHNAWAEEVLSERGYRVSVTTDTGHINRVVQGDNNSLRLLGRMNVNDNTTEKELQAYLQRK